MVSVIELSAAIYHGLQRYYGLRYAAGLSCPGARPVSLEGGLAGADSVLDRGDSGHSKGHLAL